MRRPSSILAILAAILTLDPFVRAQEKPQAPSTVPSLPALTPAAEAEGVAPPAEAPVVAPASAPSPPSRPATGATPPAAPAPPSMASLIDGFEVEIGPGEALGVMGPRQTTPGYGLEAESRPAELAEDVYQGFPVPRIGPTPVANVRS